MSGVDQAYRYAINLPCDYLVTNLREIRLYHKSRDQRLERFEIGQLAEQESPSGSSSSSWRRPRDSRLRPWASR